MTCELGPPSSWRDDAAAKASDGRELGFAQRDVEVDRLVRGLVRSPVVRAGDRTDEERDPEVEEAERDHRTRRGRQPSTPLAMSSAPSDASATPMPPGSGPTSAAMIVSV